MRRLKTSFELVHSRLQSVHTTWILSIGSTDNATIACNSWT